MEDYPRIGAVTVNNIESKSWKMLNFLANDKDKMFVMLRARNKEKTLRSDRIPSYQQCLQNGLKIGEILVFLDESM